MISERPLGRGLSSLIPRKSAVATPPPVLPAKPPPATTTATSTDRPDRSRLFDIPPQLIDPNPHQPRRRTHDETLDELVDSIRQHGIIQPLVVSRVGDRYQLIAGERRLRAAERLGLAAVPAIIRESREQEKLELAIVENVQRQDLNPIEEALAYQQLSEEFGLTQDEIARQVGKRRTTIANAVRLLALPSAMQQALRQGTITASHAKILLTAITPEERQRLFDQILKQQLPVRAAAHLGQQTTVRRHLRRVIDPTVRAIEDELRSRFGTKVKITKREHRGSVSIEFYSDEEFQHLLSRLRGG